MYRMFSVGLIVALLICVCSGCSLFRKVTGSRPATKAAALDIEMIGLALDMYAADNGQYPTTEQGLEALITKPTLPPEPSNWVSPYLQPTNFLDPWGNRYNYVLPSTREDYNYELFSYGPDGKEGGGDDIANWLAEE